MVSLLKQWWNKVKVELQQKPDAQENPHTAGLGLDDPADLFNTETLSHQMQDVLHALETNQPPNPQTITENLQVLDALLEDSTNQTTDQKASLVKEHLGIPEAYQILRENRWPHGVQCTHCQSYNIRRLPQQAMDSEHNHRYRCLDCRLEFNDDDGVITSSGAAEQSLTTWMQCWYLMGCSDSLNYIAHFLGLDLHVVEWMVQRLKTLFNLEKPNRRLQEAETQQQDLFNLQTHFDRLASDQALNANVATMPIDTTEYRRQQTIRRSGQPNSDPTAPSGTPKRKR